MGGRSFRHPQRSYTWSKVYYRRRERRDEEHSCRLRGGRESVQGDKNVEVMRQRDRYVDVAKGIAMLLIVSIHTEGFGVFGYPLAFVAVPIFFFMSGFYDRSERDFMVWLPKALRTLILPAVVWIVVATLYAQLLGYAKDMSWGDLPFDWYNIAGSNGPAWFLFALLYAKMMVWAMLKVKLPKTILGG